MTAEVSAPGEMTADRSGQANPIASNRDGNARRVLIVAGEASGDAQAARLVRAMRERAPTLRVYGVGGSQMREAGFESFFDASELSVMGVSEVAGALGRIREVYKRIVNELKGATPPDLLVLVDFPEFNLVLARKARRLGCRVLYYVSPQVWAWRKRRVRKIAERVDRMIVLFPFEVGLYEEFGLDTHFVGHPLAAEVAADRDAERTREKYGIAAERPLIALLPGSRAKEVRNVLPLMLEAGTRLGSRASFVIAKAPGLDAQVIENEVAQTGVDVTVVEDDTYNVVAAADAVAVTSGTATVECALLGRPMVVVYRMSRMTYAVARRLVRVDHIAMPNIILGKRVVPELVQEEATGKRLALELERFLSDEAYAGTVKAELSKIRQSLVRPGAAEAAADLALEMLR